MEFLLCVHTCMCFGDNHRYKGCLLCRVITKRMCFDKSRLLPQCLDTRRQLIPEKWRQRPQKQKLKCGFVAVRADKWHYTHTHTHTRRFERGNFPPSVSRAAAREDIIFWHSSVLFLQKALFLPPGLPGMKISAAMRKIMDNEEAKLRCCCFSYIKLLGWICYGRA